MRDLLTVPVRPEENVYLVRSLEGAGEAVMFAAPIRLSHRQRWSWTLRSVVQVTSDEARKLARLRNTSQ